MTIARKITLLFATLSGLIIFLLSGFVWYFSNEFAFEDFYKRMEARVNINAQIKLVEDTNNPAYAEMRNRYLERLPSERDYITEVVGNNFIAKTDIKLPRSFYTRIKAGAVARYRKENHFYAGKYFKSGQKSYIVIVSANDPVGFRELQALQRTLIVGFLLAIALSIFIGWKFSDYVLTPLRKVIISVKKIKAENLHLRLEPRNGSDEMSQLVETFNNMLVRLETAFETQNNFISNASHELRTPLTVISGEVELATMNLEDPQRQIDALHKIKEESERLENIITSLLGLAQSGFNGKNQPWELVRIDELLWEITSSIKQVQNRAQIALNLDALPADQELLEIKANKNLLKLAISNIVSNACKYSDYKPVTVSIFYQNATINIIVKDKGIGIPPSDISHIFEPFFRASNTHSFTGYGIGLPLSLNIIRMHRGSIIVKSEEAIGTDFQIVLPTTFTNSSS